MQNNMFQNQLNRRTLSTPQDSNRFIGRYEIIYPISHGGMASVYACRLTGLAGFQRLLALKIIHPHLASEKKFIEMFLDEARLSAGIHHPNVGEVIEVGEDRGTYYMVCELILGQTLGRLYRRARNDNLIISPAICAQIVSLVATGLHSAHELKSPSGKPLNIVHRDISPRNILVSYEGFVKLIDFGVAYAKEKISHTDTGTLKGKVRYMSPEQVKCQPLDRRSDIFSLGIVLYELVTGRSPFIGENDLEEIKNIIEYRIEWPHKIDKDVPLQLDGIIKKAMAFLPEDRYPSAAAMSQDLEVFIQKTGDSAGTKNLSKLMNALFARERDSHWDRIKTLQENPTSIDLAAFPERTPNTEPESQISVKPLRDVIDLSHSPSKAPVSGRPLDGQSTARKAATLGLLLFGLLIVTALVWLPASSTAPSGIPPSQTPSSENVSQKQKSEATIPGMPIVSSNLDSAKQVEQIRIVLDLKPPDTTIMLDGFTVSPTDNILRLTKDGEIHRLQFYRQGYARREELVSANADTRLVISLTPIPKQSAHYSGRKSQIQGGTTSIASAKKRGAASTGIGKKHKRGTTSLTGASKNTGTQSIRDPQLPETNPYD